jgi:hypothetical protein
VPRARQGTRQHLLLLHTRVCARVWAKKSQEEGMCESTNGVGWVEERGGRVFLLIYQSTNIDDINERNAIGIHQRVRTCVCVCVGVVVVVLCGGWVGGWVHKCVREGGREGGGEEGRGGGGMCAPEFASCDRVNVMASRRSKSPLCFPTGVPPTARTAAPTRMPSASATLPAVTVLMMHPAGAN